MKKTIDPPRLAHRFFRWYCHPRMVNHIEGDLLEDYRDRVHKKGKWKADVRFVLDVLLLLRPEIIRPLEGYKNLNTYGMYKSYFKIGWRNLLKNKGFGVINIVGLSIGVSACLLIALFILHEMSYDKHIPDSENIYRLTQYFNMDGKDEWGVHHPAPMASTMKSDFIEIEKAGRIMDNPQRYGAGSNEIQVEGNTQQFHETGFAYADQSILDMLHIPFIHGDGSSALEVPFSIVFSESKSKKFFKNENPVGKIIYLNGKENQPFVISGVMKDFPANSNFDYEFFITLKGATFYDEGEEARWSQRNFTNLVQIRSGTDIVAFKKKLTEVMYDNYILPFYRNSGRTKNAELLATQSRLELQPLQDIHLYSGQIKEGKSRGDIRFIWIFASIAFFILVIASINFINLSTAQSTTRAKEVGLRKVVGSRRQSLIAQFLAESFITTLFAFAVGLGITFLALPYFNELAQRSIDIPWTSNWFLPSLLASIVLVSILAGLYPSFYLSKFNPVHVLKGAVSSTRKSPGLRSALVVFQFTISIVLIACALIVQDQMNFIMTRDLGFDKDQVIQIQGVNATGNVAAFKNELRQIAGITNASNSSYLPVEGSHRNSSNVEPLPDGDPTNFQAQFWQVDEDYIETLGMNLVLGRNFGPKNDMDSLRPAIINQAMAKALGYKDPIGHRISQRQRLEIIGIVEDFNYQTIEEQIQPLVFVYNSSSTVTSVKINAENIPDLLVAIEGTWKKFAPTLEFRYTFMDESYGRMYDNVRRMGLILNCFTFFTIFIACLGLFGLSAFMIEQRRKELGVRKVLGASLASIFNLSVKYFIVLVGISFLMAIPIAIYIMHNWLQGFAYRIEISWPVFALTGMGALALTLLTVSYQSIKAALVNPVNSLRSE
jgi:putative ABC transport system permease protein